MNKLTRLLTYADKMKRRLTEAGNPPAKLAWIKLEIKRTQLDIDELTLNKGAK